MLLLIKRFDFSVVIREFSKMTKNAIEDLPTKKRTPKPVERFNKLRIFQMLGLLGRKFNYETLEFERSRTLQLWCLISLISKPLFAFAPLISGYFPKTHCAQLIIGSIYNYLPSQQNYFIRITGGVAGKVIIMKFVITC